MSLSSLRASFSATANAFTRSSWSSASRAKPSCILMMPASSPVALYHCLSVRVPSVCGPVSGNPLRAFMNPPSSLLPPLALALAGLGVGDLSRAGLGMALAAKRRVGSRALDARLPQFLGWHQRFLRLRPSLRRVSASRARWAVLPDPLAAFWIFLTGILPDFPVPSVLLSAPLFLIAPWMKFLPPERFFERDDDDEDEERLRRPIGDFLLLAAARPPLRCAALDGPRLRLAMAYSTTLSVLSENFRRRISLPSTRFAIASTVSCGKTTSACEVEV